MDAGTPLTKEHVSALAEGVASALQRWFPAVGGMTSFKVKW
jgi:hypothetical protein